MKCFHFQRLLFAPLQVLSFKGQESQGAFDLLESHSVKEWNLDTMVRAMLSLFFHRLHSNTIWNPKSPCLLKVSQNFCFRTCIPLSASTLYTENTVEKEIIFTVHTLFSTLGFLAHHSYACIQEYAERKLGYKTSKIWCCN